MRKVVFGGACSLDGRLARDDGSVDWLIWSDDAAALMQESWPRFDTFVMGRKTFDVAMASAGAENAANPYGDVPTYVFSRTMPAGKLPSGAEVIGTDPGDLVAGLKQMDGGDICVMGGGDLARTLFEAGMIDEIGLNVHPILLGSGPRVFHELTDQINLELIETRQMSGGCFYVSYRVVGP